MRVRDTGIYGVKPEIMLGVELMLWVEPEVQRQQG